MDKGHGTGAGPKPSTVKLEKVHSFLLVSIIRNLGQRSEGNFQLHPYCLAITRHISKICNMDAA